MGRRVKRVVATEEGREKERAKKLRPAREWGKMGEKGQESSSKRKKGKAAPFIVGQAYLAVAR